MAIRAIPAVDNIPDNKIRQTLEALRETSDILTGIRGEFEERALTIADLIEAGVIENDRGTLVRVQPITKEIIEGFVAWLNDDNAARIFARPTVIKAVNFTITLAQNGSLFANVGASVIITGSLPSATVGLEYWFVRKNAANDFRVDPDGTETINGGGAGKFLELDADGESVALKCVFAGFWNIIASNGTLSFEP